MPCLHLYSYFWWCGYFWGPYVSFVTADEFSVRVKKITSKMGVSWTHSLPFIFNLFKLNELWPYYEKHVNQIILNCITLWSLALWIFEAFVQILLIVNLSLNQTLLTFLLCVRQTWMTQLILAISLWQVIFLEYKRTLVLICMVSQFMWKKDFLFHMTYLKKTLQILMFSTGFTSLM